MSSSCWPYAGALCDGGYGIGSVEGRAVRVHRAVYEVLVGPIPEGMQLDHRCRNRACYNPAHLEPVSPAENVRRGLPFRPKPTHCVRGHTYNEQTLYVSPRGWHVCRVCQADLARSRRGKA